MMMMMHSRMCGVQSLKGNEWSQISRSMHRTNGNNSRTASTRTNNNLAQQSSNKIETSAFLLPDFLVIFGYADELQ